jgi:hypothetical protein
MGERELTVSKHAAERLWSFGLLTDDLEKVIREGERTREGKTKTRYRLRTKKGLLIAICREYPDQILVITVTRRR